jgi:hypothetical protein
MGQRLGEWRGTALFHDFLSVKQLPNGLQFGGLG